MTFLIATLLIILLLLSWKYIKRLEPAGVFALVWTMMFVAILLMQEYFELRFYGMLYLLGIIIFFSIGSNFCDSTLNPEPAETVLTFRKSLATPMIIVLLISAMVNPIYSIVLHGFSLQALLSMQDLLNLNKEMSEMRYSGAEVHDMISQVFLIFSYTAPLMGGFCYRGVNKMTKAVCILTLIPGLFIALTQSMKMVMMTGFILWFTGYIVYSFSYGRPIRIKAKTILYSILGMLGFFLLLFSSMVLRTGEISERTILDIGEKFFTYALGHFHCFDFWFTSYEPANYSWGTKTFMGLSNLLGLEERVQGIYTEYMQVGKNGYHGISNVFTAFRPLIEDFGEAGSYAVMFALGFIAKLSLKYLTAKKMIFLNQTVLSALYAYLIWSFTASFFAYTSYLAMFFLAYFLFRLLQKETALC
jgi:oligosaccharide repeat unit polymerase